MMMLADDGGGHGSGIDDHEVQGRNRSTHGEFEFADRSLFLLFSRYLSRRVVVLAHTRPHRIFFFVWVAAVAVL